MPYQLTPDQIAAMMGGQPPPGYFSGALGGAETPGGAVAGVPVPLGPAETTPGGMRITPVSRPAAAGGAPPLPQSALEGLRQQMGVVNELAGPSPMAPYVAHMMTPGSPTAGLASLGGVGRPGMVGDQTPTGVTVDPGAALATHIFGIQDQGHGQDVSQMLRRLGVMGSQALQGGQLSLEAMRALGVPGAQGSIQNAADAAKGVDNPDRARGAATITNAIAAHRAANPSATLDQTHNAVAAGMGISVNDMLRRLGVPVGQPSPPVAGTGGQTAPRQAPAGGLNPALSANPVDPREVVQNEGRGLTPWSGIESQLNAARMVPPPPGAAAGTTGTPRNIGQFLLNLNNSSPGMVPQNLPAVQSYIRDRWGDSAANSAFRAALDPRQLDNGMGSNFGERLLTPWNLFRQTVSGPTENEQGLSMLGNLLRSQQR